MESGSLSEWYQNDLGGEFNTAPGDSTASRDFARTGSWSAKLDHPTTGVAGTRLFRWGETREYPQAYYSAWFYFPVDYQVNSWWNIFQFKSKAGSKNDSFWQLGIWNRADGSMYVNLYDWQNAVTHNQAVIDVPVGQWFQLEMYYDQDPANGSLKVWQDGILLWDIRDVPTMYGGGEVGWSINNYGEAISPAPSIYIDDAAVSLTPTH